MELSILKLTKSYNQRNVFKHLTFRIPSGARCAITGPNGSGKSTLIKILSGGLLPSKGEVHYQIRDEVIAEDQLFKYVHFVAPYNTVIEELNLMELFEFHQRLGLLKGFDTYRQWVDRLDYRFDPERQIKAFSSGMKQRVKLGLALLDDRPLILLDEPGSNLDVDGKAWMVNLIKHAHEDQTIVIATNDPTERALCSDVVAVGEEEP